MVDKWDSFIAQGLSQDAAETSVASQPSRTLTRGMVDKRDSFIAQGLSQDAAETCVASRSTSTHKNYESGWSNFSTWCRGQNIDPNESSVPDIVEYLQSLLNAKKSVNTLKSRVSAIAFFHPGRTFRGSLGQHDTVKAFISGAVSLHPPVRDKFPTWDLPTVLQALMEEPFEPLADLSLAQLTKKTLFLVAICFARRIGELHALDCRPPFCSAGQGGVVLKANPSFRPKVPTIANLESSIEFAPYGIDDDGNDLPERALCVCRALQRYLEMTRDIRQDTTQLFVTFKSGHQGKPASKVTMAGWLMSIIQQCYELQGKEIPKGIKAHSTRAASAS
jgi:hypothetical protein